MRIIGKDGQNIEQFLFDANHKSAMFIEHFRDIILAEFKLVYFTFFTDVWRKGLPLLSAQRKSGFEKRPSSSALNVFPTIASFVLLRNPAIFLLIIKIVLAKIC